MRRIAEASRAVVVAGLFAAFVAGCTQLPTREFEQYREAFDQARTAGEGVVLDWGAADDQVKALGPAGSEDEAPVGWSHKAVEARLRPADHVGARLEAWAIVGHYNEALVALAEGRNASELGERIGALAGGLNGFPWAEFGGRAVRAAAGANVAIGPAVELVRTLAVEAQREGDRRKFVAAVKEAGPLLRVLTTLLKEDADDFWNVRRGLSDRQQVLVLAQLRSRLRDAGEVLGRHAAVGASVEPGDDAAGAEADRNDAAVTLERLDAVLRRVPEHGRGLEPLLEAAASERATDAPDIDAAGVARLRALTADAESLVGQSVGLAHEFAAYQLMLEEYVRLLLAVEDTLTALEAAAELAEPGLPPTEDLLHLVRRVRRTIESYEKARK